MSDDPRFEAIRRRGGPRYAAFLAAGYREWYAEHGGKSTPYLLQKRVRGDRGETKYFINIWFYDYAEYLSDVPAGCQPEVQFGTRGPGPTFGVVLHPGEMAPAEIEAFFARMYAAMGCTPYGEAGA